MLQLQLVVVHLALVIALLWWNSSSVLLAEAAPEPLEPSAALGMGDHPIASEEKSTTNLAAKLFLLDNLVSLENEVTETKKKRSFSGFGSPIDRISSSSGDAKGKQRLRMALTAQVSHLCLPSCGESSASLQGYTANSYCLTPCEKQLEKTQQGCGCWDDAAGGQPVPERKVLELPKRRFGVPLDRIGVSHLGNTRG